MTGKRLRILLIDVPSVSPNVLNIGLASVGTVLQADGHEVRGLDLNNINVPGSRERRLAAALEREPDVVAISVFPACTYTFKQTEILLAAVRGRLSGSPLYVLGGIGITVGMSDVARRFAGLADLLVYGEGETTMREVAARYAAGEDLRGIAGTMHFDDGEPTVNEARPMVADLDTIPLPDYDIFDSVAEVRTEYPIMTSRGCPFNCIFCLNKTLTQRRFRARSARNVVDEVKQAIEKHRFDALYIWDDHFSLQRERAEDICRLFIEECPGLTYYLPDGIRADSVTPEFARLLKESGCAGVSVGFEDANPETFPSINKGEEYADIITAIGVLQDAGVPVRASMVIGLPGQTYDSVVTGMKNVEKLHIHAEWYLAAPFPGTEFYDWVMRHGRLLEDPLSLRALTFRRVIFDTPEFTRSQRYRAFYRAFAHYSFPEYAFYGKVCNPLTQQRYHFEKYVVSIFAVARYIPERLPSHLWNLARDLVSAVGRRLARLFGRT